MLAAKENKKAKRSKNKENRIGSKQTNNPKRTKG